MANLKKIRFLKRRMKSVLEHKLDENHAQTLILGLSGASLVLSGCVCQVCALAPGQLCRMLRRCTSSSRKASVYNFRQSCEFNLESEANQRG
jgi:NH3-dependent NAD+ synthetase